MFLFLKLINIFYTRFAETKFIVTFSRFSGIMAEAAPGVVPVVRPTLTCRFYEERFPQLHEAVNTNVTSIGDMGAYVKLLEYNNVDGKYRYFQCYLYHQMPPRNLTFII